MKKNVLIAALAAALAMVQVSSAAPITIYDDDFNDGDLATNPDIGGGSVAASNGIGTDGTVTETNSLAMIAEGDGNNSMGFATSSAFDLSDATQRYTATWTVAAWDPTTSATARNLRFNIQSNEGWVFGGSAEESRLLLTFNDSANTVVLTYQNRSGGANANHASSTFALGAFAGDTNGFTVSVVCDEIGYDCTTSGLDADNQLALSGTWATLGAGTTFAEIFQTDGDMHVSSFIQDSGGIGQALDIDRVTLTSAERTTEIKVAPGALSLELVAPDTSTNGTITASYFAGAFSSNDVEVVSLAADAGFSATPGSFILGTVNTNQDITVAFDNSSIGLSNNGDVTNSTLIITWTEAGSGVTNTSEVALDVTYIDEPSSLALVPASLALQLNGPDTSIDGTIVASFVAGTFPTDVEVVSLVADAGFSAAPGSFSLGTGNTNEDITVTFDNSSIGLSSAGDSTNSTLIITWMEAGSGVTNTSEAALNVYYIPELDPADIIFEATTANTTLVGNRTPIVGSITGTLPALQINDTGGSFDNVGFASTESINTLNGEPLTTNDTVTFKAVVTGITGNIRANCVEFGMSPTAEFRGTTTDHLIYSVQANNELHKFMGTFENPNQVTLAHRSSEASLKDGFTFTLVVNAAGYTFTLNDIVNSADGGATTIIQSGTFAGNEFLDYFAEGHFYLGTQKWDTTDVVMSISEAFIAVETSEAEEPVITGSYVSDGNFNLEFTGTVGKEYGVESSDNLTLPDNWGPVTNFTLPESPMTVGWPTTNNVIFYRVFIP